MEYEGRGSGSDILDSIFDHTMSSNAIFSNRDVLRGDYIPERILFREEQMSQLGQMLAPILRKNKPSNIFLYGKTGTGKTVVARYVLRKLKERAAQYNLNVGLIYTNARLASTQYRILLDMGAQLGIQLPFTGLSISEALARVLGGMSMGEGAVGTIVVLDEIDYLVKNYDDNILYELTRANSNSNSNSGSTSTNPFISLVGISNDLKFKEYLDPRVLSSLSEEEMVFPPYTVEELEAILMERVKVAFRSGAVSDSAVKLCASLAAAEHGDARRAVDLLRVAGELAERDGSPAVEPDHVSRAARSIEHDRTYEAIRSLPLHGKLILAAIITSGDESNTGRLYSKYSSISKGIGVEPLTQRRVSGIISELDVLGLVNAPVISNGRFGRTKRVKLVVPRETVARALGEDELISSAMAG